MPHCSICSKRISEGDLCTECANELAGASPEALAQYVASLKRDSPAAQASPPVTSTPPPTSVTITDPRIPAPEFVAALRQSGLSVEQIAAELEISVSQTAKLLTAGNRSKLFEVTREWAAKRFIPKILANIDRALNTDGDGEISMRLAKDMGIWQDPSTGQPSDPFEEADSFESWKISVTKKTKSARPSEEIVVAATEGELLTEGSAEGEADSPNDEG